MSAIGGGITITTTTGTFIQADLPWMFGFIVSGVRPMSEKTSLKGNVIRQAGTKSRTSAVVPYDAWVNQAQADNVALIDAAGSTCYLSDGKSLFEAQIDSSVGNDIRAGKKHVTIEFRVVREIL